MGRIIHLIMIFFILRSCFKALYVNQALLSLTGCSIFSSLPLKVRLNYDTNFPQYFCILNYLKGLKMST